MYCIPSEVEHFEQAFEFITQLWDYNNYNKEETRILYQKILSDPNSFAFFLVDNNSFYGFCHGVYFDTFWLSGKTCYISSLIVKPSERHKGYGIHLMNHAKKLAQEENCKGMVLDSGLVRKQAHHFYETYGFKKNCYGFDYLL